MAASSKKTAEPKNNIHWRLARFARSIYPGSPENHHNRDYAMAQTLLQAFGADRAKNLKNSSRVNRTPDPGRKLESSISNVLRTTYVGNTPWMGSQS